MRPSSGTKGTWLMRHPAGLSVIGDQGRDLAFEIFGFTRHLALERRRPTVVSASRGGGGKDTGDEETWGKGDQSFAEEVQKWRNVEKEWDIGMKKHRRIGKFYLSSQVRMGRYQQFAQRIPLNPPCRCR